MRDNDGILAVVPLKTFAFAKRRLSGLLSQQQRIALMRAMFQDVLKTLTASFGSKNVLVVSDEPECPALAGKWGAVWLAERAVAHSRGLNGTVTGVAGMLAERGEKGLLVVHADLPLLREEDIDEIMGAWRSLPGHRRVAIARSRDGGTNLLVVSPPDVLQFHFGQDSYRKHVEQCRRAGCSVTSLHLAGGLTDVDCPSDLDDIISRSTHSRCGLHTTEVLAQFGFLESSCLAKRQQTNDTEFIEQYQAEV